MSKKSVRGTEKQEATERLREWLKPGDTVYTILRHVGRSGMSREISALQLTPAGSRTHYAGGASHSEITVGSLAYNIALACGLPINRERDAVRMSGFGEDKGSALVYELSATLWPSGFGCVGEGCLSNDHSNGDRDYTPHCWEGENCKLERCPRKAHWHKDGGYALKQRWL